MAAAMKLALATTREEIRQACLSRRSGTYDVYRHMYLRYNFVTIYVLSDGRTLDAHKHFGEQGGQTEHSKFIYGIEHPPYFEDMEQFAHGPANSRPRAKKAHPKAHPKRSVALRKKLGPPLHESAQLPSEVAEAGLDAEICGEGHADLEAACANADAAAEPPAAASLSQSSGSHAYDVGKCLGRVWNSGFLGQCKNPKTHGDFCGKHTKHLTHGRVDEPGHWLCSHAHDCRNMGRRECAKDRTPTIQNPQMQSSASQAKDPKPKIQSQRSQANDPKPRIQSKRCKAKDPRSDAKDLKQNIPVRRSQR